MEERTYVDRDGVSRIERRKDTCSMHEQNVKLWMDHEARIRLLETLTTELKEQNKTQFRILEEVKSSVDKMNGKLLIIAGGIIVFLLSQLMPFMTG